MLELGLPAGALGAANVDVAVVAAVVAGEIAAVGFTVLELMEVALAAIVGGAVFVGTGRAVLRGAMLRGAMLPQSGLSSCTSWLAASLTPLA